MILMLTLAEHFIEEYYIVVLLCGITATLANDHFLSCSSPMMPFFQEATQLIPTKPKSVLYLLRRNVLNESGG